MTQPKGNITIVEEWSKFSDQQEYYSKTWHQKGSLVATVLFIHGLGEHVSRYQHVFPQFAEVGIKVFAFDQRGFGQTGKKSGILGHNCGSDRLYKDLEEANARIQVSGVPQYFIRYSFSFI